MSNKNKNKNKKAKNKSNKFKRNLSLDVTYYTEEAYMKCFPEALHLKIIAEVSFQ